MDLYAELTALTGALQRASVDSALCGALALAVHGITRATKDIDLIVPKDAEDALRGAVRSVGYTVEALPMKFNSGIQVQRFTKLVDGRPLLLDILWAEGPLRPIWERRQRVQWAHGSIDVVTREDLITLKVTAGRPQDLADIAALAKQEGREDVD